MRDLLRSAYHSCDDLLVRASLRAGIEPPALVTLLLHALDPHDRPELEPAGCAVDPAVRSTLSGMSRCIEHFLDAGYRFVTPRDILAGLDPRERHVLLSFDDGYHNNAAALPVLRAFGVPATFCISTKFVDEGMAFWWDVIYRQRRRRGVARDAIVREQLMLKRFTHEGIERYLVEQFGAAALVPVGDEDRPFTATELRVFAADPLVHLGNHAHDHGILVNYDAEGIRRQLAICQQRLREIAGYTPELVAYPNGDYDDTVMTVAREVGLQLGITTRPGRNALPVLAADGTAFELGRFSVRCGIDEDEVFRHFRAPVSLSQLVTAARHEPRRLIANVPRLEPAFMDAPTMLPVLTSAIAEAPMFLPLL